MQTVLVTGTSKGVGLEFTKQYLERGSRVIATYRGEPSAALQELKNNNENIWLIDCSLDSLDEIDRMAEILAGQEIDILISNAAIMGRAGGPAAQVGERIGTLDYDLFDLYMATNVRAPAKLVESMLENIKSGNEKKIAMISSGAGSFGMPATLPGNYWYKSSKAALNMVMRNIANDLKPEGVTLLNFHPGLVITERLEPMRDMIMKMSGQEKPFEPHDAVASMITTIERATVDDSGRFVRNDGSDMPW
ncbi:MAG: SDR family oxidoreductase [Parasphingorhabdus sp.]